MCLRLERRDFGRQFLHGLPRHRNELIRAQVLNAIFGLM